MDIQTLMDIGITIVIAVFVFSSIGLIVLVCVYLAKLASKTGRVSKTKLVHARATYNSTPIHRNAKNDILPNGYSRQEYHDHGYTDTDIECWGLDQPNAPDPYWGGFAIADMADGKLDGKFDIFK